MSFNAVGLEILTVAQVAEVLGCTEQTVNENCNTRALPAVKFGRSWMLPVKALNDHLCAMALQHVNSSKIPSEVVVAVDVKPKKSNAPPMLPPRLSTPLRAAY